VERLDATECHGHDGAAPVGAESDFERLGHGAHHGETVTDPRRIGTGRDAVALIDDLDDDALAVNVAANADRAFLAIVGVKDHVGDRLGHREGDRVRHLRRSARSGGEGRGVVPQLTDDGRHRGHFPPQRFAQVRRPQIRSVSATVGTDAQARRRDHPRGPCH
jgi:hypothetical protein